MGFYFGGDSWFSFNFTSNNYVHILHIKLGITIKQQKNSNMAHTCLQCGVSCHCGGDIDDINFGESWSCTHCECDDDFDEDDYYEHLNRLNETTINQPLTPCRDKEKRL